MSRDAQVYSVPRPPHRAAEAHKGTFGKVLVVAGSPGMVGAAALTALGALRAGTGLVTVAIPASESAAVTACVPEATQLLLPARDGGTRGRALVEVLGDDLEKRFDALVVGPGLGLSPGSRELVEVVAARFPGPQVVDADALNLVARGARLPVSVERVWTPHPGEFERLGGGRPRGDAERIDRAGRLCVERHGVVVLKGHRTVVHDGQRYFVNVTGNPGMATGGSGDVLSGVIGALLGGGLAAFEAACLGVYLHGLAGDLAARDVGEAGVLAGDIARYVPRALESLGRSRPASEGKWGHG